MGDTCRPRYTPPFLPELALQLNPSSLAIEMASLDEPPFVAYTVRPLTGRDPATFRSIDQAR